MTSDLEARVARQGYTPRDRDVPSVLALLAHEDPDVVHDAERALLAAGPKASTLALQAFQVAVRPLRGRLTHLIGRFARGEGPDGPLARFLVECLADSDAEVRRRAVSALGRLADARFEGPLLSAWDAASLPEDRRAVARALGNVGGKASLGRLSQPDPGDAEFTRLCEEARLKVTRRHLRSTPSGIDAMASCPVGTRVLLHVRAGFEDLLIDELGTASNARRVGEGRVQLETAEPLGTLFRARTFLHLGFPLPAESFEGAEGPVDAVVRALTSDTAFRLFTTFTRGPIRYRVEWADAGRRRAATFDAALRVQALRPELHNDGTDAVFEAVVSERGAGPRGRVHVELWPRALVDPRFAYRVRTIPAASHPTVGAALARIAGVREDDVVWDPFVGSGTELIERALLGPFASLHGTDTSAEALDAARANAARAGVHALELGRADASQVEPPEGVSLVLSNPPFGRRVRPEGGVAPLLATVLEKVGRALRPGGRLAWISPAGDTTAALAERAGLSTRLRCPVDMGGIPGELQLFVKGRGHVRPRSVSGRRNAPIASGVNPSSGSRNVTRRHLGRRAGRGPC